MRRKGKGHASIGAGLSVLALAVQVLLPFLLALVISKAQAAPDGQNGAVICSASGSGKGVPLDRRDPHGLSKGCPICTVLAASQAAAAPVLLALPAPPVSAHVVRWSGAPPNSIRLAAASYNPRAPPIGA